MESVFGDWLALFGAMGAGQGLLLALVLVSRKSEQRLTNQLLGVEVLIVSFSIAGSLLFYTKAALKFPHLAYLHSPIVMAAPAVLWFYLRSVLDANFRLGKQQMLHFIPALGYFIYLLPFFFQSAQTKTIFLKNAYASMPIDRQMYAYAMVIIQSAYLVLMVIDLKKHLALKTQNKTLYYWLWGIIVYISLIWLLGLIRALFSYNYGSSYWFPIALAMGVYLLGYHYLAFPGAFKINKSNAILSTKAEKDEVGKEKKRYEKYAEFSEKELHDLDQRLATLMEQKYFYKTPDLSLDLLASEMDSSRHLLSFYLNEYINKSFFEYINYYRVEDAKQMLLDEAFAHLSVEGIAAEVGFKSKSAFYTAFKKLTNQTPAVFKKNALKNL